jgi:hypothetical protein
MLTPKALFTGKMAIRHMQKLTDLTEINVVNNVNNCKQ